MRTTIALLLLAVPALCQDVVKKTPESSKKNLLNMRQKAARASCIPASQDKNFKREWESPGAMRVPPTEEKEGKGYMDEPVLEKIFYVSLDRSVDRQNGLEPELNKTKVKYERWRAKDAGQATNEMAKHFTRKGLKDNGGPWVPAYVSQLELLEHIANMTHDNKVYFILEDDVKFNDQSWFNKAMCHISRLPADWDMYKFGYQSEVYGDCQESRGYNEHSCQAREVSYHWMGNQAYAVRPQGAANMLAHMKEVPAGHVDGAMMNGMWYEMGGGPATQYGKGDPSTNYEGKRDTNMYTSKDSLVIHTWAPSTWQQEHAMGDGNLWKAFTKR